MDDAKQLTRSGSSSNADSPAPVSDATIATRDLIRRILASLSPEEADFVRYEIFQNIEPVEPAPTPVSFEQVPLEIVSLIAEYLQLQDALSCLRVSRAWFSMWDNDFVATSLCRQLFPGLLELHSAKPRAESRDIFLNEARRFAYRHWHLASQVSYFRQQSSWGLGRFGDSSVAPHRDAAYGEGCLAWSAKVDAVCLRYLHKNMLKTCHLGPRTRKPFIHAVTRSLLVLRGERPADHEKHDIHIWHADHGEWGVASLPGDFAACYAANENVAFVTKQQHVIIWQWGQAPVELDAMSDLRHLLGEDEIPLDPLPGVIWHPTARNIAFIVWKYDRTKDSAKREASKVRSYMDDMREEMHVLKYENGKLTRHVKKALLDVIPGAPVEYCVCMILPIVPFCYQMNSHGLYCLEVIGLRKRRDSCRPAALCFNTLTEEFYVKRYTLVREANDFSSLGQAHPQILKHRGIATGDQLIHLGRWIFSSPWAPLWYTTEGGVMRDDGKFGKPKLLRSKQLMDGMLANSPCWNIFGDEDFLVLSVNEGVYVWSFQKGRELANGPLIETTGAEDVTDSIRQFAAWGNR
ncbi:hypothetical protein HIM_06208 [Hirsutella minnesotensis 3608]|uniref:F-box domain-containing protein n=1 Tax=Hirsutella minnesotensis 3608 TaxID=1043627 RepID=A0A0F7ZU80_9HYPO|nr:hypothetical protein HIM_06208 [Hirsutella minnesotensis 3608]